MSPASNLRIVSAIPPGMLRNTPHRNRMRPMAHFEHRQHFATSPRWAFGEASHTKTTGGRIPHRFKEASPQ